MVFQYLNAQYTFRRFDHRRHRGLGHFQSKWEVENGLSSHLLSAVGLTSSQVTRAASGQETQPELCTAQDVPCRLRGTQVGDPTGTWLHHQWRQLASHSPFSAHTSSSSHGCSACGMVCTHSLFTQGVLWGMPALCSAFWRGQENLCLSDPLSVSKLEWMNLGHSLGRIGSIVLLWTMQTSSLCDLLSSNGGCGAVLIVYAVEIIYYQCHN